MSNVSWLRRSSKAAAQLSLALATVMAGQVATAEKIYLGEFSSGSIAGWEAQSFSGSTTYQLVEVDGREVLRARAEASASGLVRKQRIDLQSTPFLNWRWRVENRLPRRDESSKTGDDYPARVYVVVSGGWRFWQSRAINYVWARKEKGTQWPNAFTGESVMMLALRDEGDEIGRWYEEKRNVKADLERVLGKELRYIDAIAIMTDSDNTGAEATAFYGDLYFSAD